MKENMVVNDIPQLIEGGLAVDDRGQLQFCNNFDFKDIKRFYMVQNHKDEFVRAWHAHKYETKFVLVASGAAIVAAVKIDDWKNPSKASTVHRYILSDKKTTILKIPAGYANGFKTLAQGTKVIFFSTSSLEESMNDDIRYPADHWNPWHIEQR